MTNPKLKSLMKLTPKTTNSSIKEEIDESAFNISLSLLEIPGCTQPLDSLW